jgi:Na+/proline symporter
LALYWKGTTRAGIFAGLITGTLVTVAWYLTPGLKDLMYELIPGFISSLIATWVVSLFTTPAPDSKKAFEDMFDE